ncbi:hypothetical protein HPB52_017556 [Rhipicephalus sanguineus]|uniref:Uncharacterized protein n=1 Tax=Rhipicephalus sanguineus TaxID=34632 RepID=A0A9D4SZF3_RHISA|nr:hypothetical protein HPB52_017556 [Rhipicephalus sanguineus]
MYTGRVTVQGSRLSNDGGDESADDLDESHTEDLSSDILDCSKTTDTEQLSPTEDTTAAVPPAPASEADPPVTVSAAAPSDPVSGLSTAVSVSPAVVTGAAGTLAIVAGAPAAPSTTEGPINPDHWQRRFKVVKIVSSEPFGRGRWLCMDFVDPPAMQADAKAGEERDSNTAAADLPPAVSNEAVAHVYEIPVGQTYPANSQQSGPLYGIILPVSGQGASPLSVLQPIGEQQQQQPTAVAEPAAAVPPKPAAVVTPAVPEQQQAVAADVAAATQTVEPIPENATKSATEEDSESTSAGSTVAIDNKIEQAMDLVKSHLMFAVREEVDVLKEKITELLDRIAQLGVREQHPACRRLAGDAESTGSVEVMDAASVASAKSGETPATRRLGVPTTWVRLKPSNNWQKVKGHQLIHGSQPASYHASNDTENGHQSEVEPGTVEDFDISGSDVIVLLQIQNAGANFLERRLIEDLVLQRTLRVPPHKRSSWLFSRYTLGWKCGVHPDWTELNSCVDRVLDEDEGVPTKRRQVLNR